MWHKGQTKKISEKNMLTDFNIITLLLFSPSSCRITVYTPDSLSPCYLDSLILGSRAARVDADTEDAFVRRVKWVARLALDATLG